MTERLHARCCVAGGGPAGMMLGFLLARAGVDVVVLEKHADFFRDFRGDTIHPSTLEIMYELGLLTNFLALPHTELHRVTGQIGSETIPVADFSHLPTRCKFIALMPQWDFLNFLAGEAKHYPSFHLRMEAAVTGLLPDGDRVAGVRATTPAGDLEVAADLVIGADGRHSDVRALAGLVVHTLGAPIDVLWMRVSHQPADPPQSLGRVNRGQILVMLDRGSYWQCAYIIRKGAFAEVQRRGLEAFRADLATIAPFAADRLGEIHDWADVKLLTVIVDRLTRWERAGLLCIGDAAHAMSPVGGIGINLAIQDAVAAANILASTLRHGAPSTQQLHAVQSRREWPTRVTQRAQVLMQDRVISPILGRPGDITVPWPVRLLGRWSLLQRIPARFIGMGVRPEHVRSPTAHAPA